VIRHKNPRGSWAEARRGDDMWTVVTPFGYLDEPLPFDRQHTVIVMHRNPTRYLPFNQASCPS